MDSFTLAAFVFACSVGGALAGMPLGGRLPGHHISKSRRSAESTLAPVRTSLRLTTVLAPLVAASSVFAESSFVGLGDLPGAGVGSYATAVSANGSIVVGGSGTNTCSDNHQQAYRWEGGVMDSLGCIGPTGFGSQSWAYAISADGTVVVGEARDSSSSVRAFRWTSGGGLTTILPGSNAYGASSDGSTIVGMKRAPEYSAFRWHNGTVTYLSAPGYPYSLARAVSADGSVIVGIGILTAEDARAVRWIDGTAELLALPPGATASEAYAVSGDGSVIVGTVKVQAGTWEAYRWVNGTPEALGSLNLAGREVANAVSADGNVIVGGGTPTGSFGVAFLWTPETGMRNLREALIEIYGLDVVSAWVLYGATGVSADGGVIVGYGGNAAGAIEGWRAGLEKDESEIVVTVTGDESNDEESRNADLCDVDVEEDGLQCTLRAAIELANERGGATITFDIPGGGVPSIQVTDYRDVLDEPYVEGLPTFEAPIVLDATTQPGGWVEVYGDGVRGVTDITAEPSDGIRIGPGAGGSEVRGLVINRFTGSAVRVLSGADGCLITGNRLGTDVTGTQAMGTPNPFLELPESGNRLRILDLPDYGFVPVGAGVRLASNGNFVEGNVIAGNAQRIPRGELQRFSGGIEILLDKTAHGNFVRRNRIGVGADGQRVQVREAGDDSFGAFHIGVVVQGSDNTIGGGPGDGNEIADYTWAVVVRAPSGHLVASNTIGHAALDEWQHPEGSVGLALVDASSSIGDPTAAHTRARAEGNDVRSLDAAAIVVGAYDVNDNVLHGAIGSSAGPPTGGEHLWHLDAAVSIDGDVEFAGNEVHAPGWSVIVSSGQGVVVADNDIHGGYGGIRVLEDEDTEETRVALVRNEITTVGLGIDLGGLQYPDGVTKNDSGDADEGPNQRLNFPDVLTATTDGGEISVEGFVDVPLLDTAPYFVEVFSNARCSTGEQAFHGGWAYGPGEHYLGVGGGNASLGYADFEITLEGLPAGHTHVALTATRLDLGVTSEFSRCVALAAADQVASAEVPSDASGPVLDDRGVTVSVISAAALRSSPGAATEGAGKLYVTRYDHAPERSLFDGAAAPAPNGAEVRPGFAAPRYWSLADRGLTQAGGAMSDSRMFEVCLDPTGVVPSDDLPETVVIQRNEATGGVWGPLETTSEQHGDDEYLCASGLTALGEFGFGLAAMCGDSNASRTISAGDALLILKASVGGDQCADVPCACDVNANGALTASDALAVLKSAVLQTPLESCTC